MSPPELQMTPAVAGWYFVRAHDGPGHVNGLQRFPIGAWALRNEGGKHAVPLLSKPGEPGLVAPSPEDAAALVGMVPPDREWQTFFSSEDVVQAVQRLFAFRSGAAPAEAEPARAATVQEVEMPGVGKVPVRDARPPGQQAGGTDDWIARAWGGKPGQPRLGGA